MGVFKWLRRERVTVTTSHISSGPPSPEEEQPPTHISTIRTEEYKRDLAEFQARRSAGHRELQETPVKKKCGRNSLPVSCTDCTGDPDTTFNYEKKSAIKYKKKRARSSQSEEKVNESVPNIQFLFQNQVFMPGNIFGPSSFSEPQKSKRRSKQNGRRSSEMDFLVHKQIDFTDGNQPESPPIFFKNNSLPFDVKNFLDGKRTDDEVDGLKVESDERSSQNSSEESKVTRGDDKLWEVMGELKKLDDWADGHLLPPSANTSKTEDNKSDTSAYGLPVVSSSNLDVTTLQPKVWSHGKWGVVPVQMKKLPGVTIEHVKKKRNTEINILRKCRHPNIILLMGLFPDVQNNVNIICERCIDTLYGILHVQGRILSAQTSVHYALDVANALVFLRMQGYLHTDLTSAKVIVTAHDTAKLADLASCVKLVGKRMKLTKEYQLYSPEPQYVNIEDTRDSNQADCEPLLSARSSEAYISANAVPKDHKVYSISEHYHWQAPELFEPNDEGIVYPCSRSDVYSLCLILWECCNASMPWKTLSYDKLKELYTLWKTGIRLPQDGTYPGCLLELLRQGLTLQREQRVDLTDFQKLLQNAKNKLDEIEYIIIPARLSKKTSNFTAQDWDTVSPTDSEYQSPKHGIEHRAVVHFTRDSSSESDKRSRSDTSPLYEAIKKTNTGSFGVAEKCFLSDDENDNNQLLMKYVHLQEKESSSACSTPLAKLRVRVKDLDTPGMLHRSDSTEYCSILSPDTRTNYFGPNDSAKDQSSVERPTTKLSRSFTPKSYKPLHIKVPEFNLDSVKTLLKDRNSNERSTYNFDIKNYSLPTTPIARSNKLRKNAWLSGELSVKDRSNEKLKDTFTMSTSEENAKTETMATSTDSSKGREADTNSCKEFSMSKKGERSPESEDTVRDCFTGLRRVSLPHDFSSPETDSGARDGGTWSFKSSSAGTATKCRVEEDVLANVNVKPLVAIHEKWIYEANRKCGRSTSLPEYKKATQGQALKPASHCVDTLQKSLPQLYKPKSTVKTYRTRPASPASTGSNGGHWDQYCQAREAISKNFNLQFQTDERFKTWRRDSDKGTPTEECPYYRDHKVDQSTNTRSIDEIFRDLIRTKSQQLLPDNSDDASETASLRRNEELLTRCVANVLESLRNGDDEHNSKDSARSFSRVKINGNNKPLLQITFSRSGENSLQVLDGCVNVTIGEGRDKLHQSMEETLTADDVQGNSLKRCQAFSAIQEARSTEDLYIDDDLSTHMQENFGGRLRMVPLHGSLHELLCDKRDECCLLKVKQENGCDAIYYRCDTSDTESRDAVDAPDSRDTVVFKRSISLVEERIQRVPKRTGSRKRREPEAPKPRPKSENLETITTETRSLSNSTPSLFVNDARGEVEVNIENVMCYQDSSSDECLGGQEDDFEIIEREIEREVTAGNLGTLACGCLEKISEENLSVLNEEATDKD